MLRSEFEASSPEWSGSSPMVVLVDEADGEVGVAEKLDCHRQGRLHRAISVNLTDAQGRMLLQRRALGKYHSGGAWSNACCSHPAPRETALAAAQRRLWEELGVACDLKFDRLVRYRAEVGGGLIENELVHFFSGTYDGPVRADPEEVDSHEWVPPETMHERLRAEPESFSPWFRIYVERGAI